MRNKYVFLDRDGVLNIDAGTYTFELEKLIIIEKVPEALELLRQNGYQLIVITNQAGIAKGMYTESEVMACNQKIQEACGHLIQAIYYSPYHPSVTESLGRKPGTLLFERAIAKFGVDVASSWMIGDKERDLEPAQKVGITGRILLPLGNETSKYATHYASSLWEAVNEIILR